MIGERVESRPQFPVLGTIFFLMALGLFVVAVALNNGHYALGAVLPLTMSLALFCLWSPRFVAHFTPEGLEVEKPETFIPYDTLQGIKGKGRSSDPRKPGRYSFAIQVIHDNGVLEIPAKLNVPSEDVFLFLWEQFPPEGSRGVPRILREHLAEQEKTFGADRVWGYRARSHLGTWKTHRRATGVFFAVFVTGIIWAAIGFPLGFPAWGGFGIMLAFFGFIFFIALLASNKARAGGRVKNWRNAGLVISPVGLALVQGDLKGEMRWDELRDLQYRSRPQAFSFNAETGMPGILLKFEGASIIIADIYDQPLRVIFERIQAYWK
jgi:hypothetical protein